MSAVIKLSFPATKQFWEIPILFEDDHLLALYKPSGLTTSLDTIFPERPSLMQLLHDAIAQKKPWTSECRLTFLAASHHLDDAASGALLVAKSKAVQAALADKFSTDSPERKYVAIVRGSPQADSFEVDAKLAPHQTETDLMCIDARRGKKSKTRVVVTERFSGYAMVTCEPVPDRNHQIRLHLRHSGLPLCGDELYGGRPLLLSRLKKSYRLKEGRTELPLLSRPALHAREISIPHPVTGDALTISAPLPKDIRVALKYLRQFSGTNPQASIDPSGEN